MRFQLAQTALVQAEVKRPPATSQITQTQAKVTFENILRLDVRQLSEKKHEIIVVAGVIARGVNPAQEDQQLFVASCTQAAAFSPLGDTTDESMKEALDEPETVHELASQVFPLATHQLQYLLTSMGIQGIRVPTTLDRETLRKREPSEIAAPVLKAVE